jgi:hypothetical protein
MLHSGEKLSMKNNKGNIEKICRVDLSFLCTALFLKMIYPAMKFQVDTSNTFLDMRRTKLSDGKTDGQTFQKCGLVCFFFDLYVSFLP